MNAINRSVMLVLALVLVAVPVLLLLVAFGVLSAGALDAYTGYSSAVGSLSSLPGVLSGGAVGREVGIAGVVAAAVALTLLLAELSYKPKGVKSIPIRGESGGETKLTSRAARRLFEAAALGAGASSATAKVVSRRKGYGVLCKIEVPAQAGMSEVAGAVRQNIERAAGQQEIRLGTAEVTVKGVSREEGSASYDSASAGSHSSTAQRTRAAATDTNESREDSDEARAPVGTGS